MFKSLKVQVLIYLDILVNILGADKAEEEDISNHSHNKPVAGDVTCTLGNDRLECGHKAATNNHCHEDTRSSLSVLAQPLNSEVEDTAPHDRGAETASSQEEYLDGNLVTLELCCNAFGQENGSQQ